MKQSARIVRCKPDRTFPLHKAGRSASLYSHLIFRRGLEIVQANRPGENAADGADTEAHLQVITAFTRLLELFATRETLGDLIRICQKPPYGESRNPFK